jgi:hypothetical protein
MVRLDRSRGRRADLSGWRNLLVCRRGRASRLRRLVLPENETASPHHMKAKIWSILLLSVFSPVGQALACPFCYGAKDGKSTEHMAVAIWFLFGAVMSVLGGIGAFSFHLWRHGRMPSEPYQEMIDEDLGKYE